MVDYMSDILNKVIEITAKHVNTSVDTIKASSNFVSELGLDSLDVVELVMAIEEEFDIEVPDDKAENLVTVGDVVKYIEEQIGT